MPVAEDETAWSLARKLDRPALSLLRELVAQLAAGERPSALAQDEAAVTEAPEPSPEDLGVDWKDDAEAIVRLVRAAFPLGASVRLGDEDADLVAASLCDETPPLGLRPSEAWRTEDGAWAVRCGTGAITLDAVADPDGEPVDLDTWLELAELARPDPLASVLEALRGPRASCVSAHARREPRRADRRHSSSRS
ncbi:MAG: hypothetical protein H6720_03545 [Sandaracinus sp.]|nr:hypothetical protein [Sandaracinus sp.]